MNRNIFIAASAAALALAGGVATFASADNPHVGSTTAGLVRVTGSDSSPTVIVTGDGTLYQYHPVATCPTGDVVTGGGADPADTSSLHTVRAAKEGPTSDGTGWQLTTNSGSGETWSVVAICIPGTTTP